MQTETLQTALLRRDSIEEMEGHRNRALELYRKAAELIKEANAVAQRVAKKTSGFDLGQQEVYHLQYSVKPDDFVARVKKSLDSSCWAQIVERTRLGTLMDANTKSEFERQMSEKPIEFTADNVLATLTTLTAKAPDTFKKGVVTAFRSFSKDHRTNDAYKVGPKAVIKYVVEWRDWSGYNGSFCLRWGRSRDELNDIERCFHILDGKDWTGCGGIAQHMDKAISDGIQNAESQYIKAKWFKNGNVHLEFKRPDLVQGVNKIITEHFGETLANGKRWKKAA